MSVIDTASAPIGNASLDASELAALVHSFKEVTTRLEETHSALRSEVAELKSELAEAHERLERSRQLAALGEMAAGIAHEIRNPLGCITLNLEALTEDLHGSPEHLQLCGQVSRAVAKLDGIVGDVLTFARDTRVRPRSCHLIDVLRSALASTSDLLESGDVDVRFDAEDTVEAEIDAALLEQSVLNVLRNACEAMCEHETDFRQLEISLREGLLSDPEGRSALHAIITVRDTGPGIPADVRERMFNPFFTTRNEGTGLGLAIVHRIVDAHCGRVTVSDAEPGAIVELALPVIFAGVSVSEEKEDQSLAGAVRRRVQESSDRGAA